MADELRLNIKHFTWKSLISFPTFFYMVTLQASDLSAALLPQSPRNIPDLGNDRFELPNGSPEWCLYCHDEHFSQSLNIEDSCHRKNEIPLEEIIHDDYGFTNALYCSGKGKPPKCNDPELPGHTHAVANDPSHLHYTHTYLTVSCEDGYKREPLSAHPHIILQCNGIPPVWNSSGLDNFKCVINSTSHSPSIIDNTKIVSNTSTLNEIREKVPGRQNEVLIGVSLGCLCLLIGGVLLVLHLRKRGICRSGSDSEERPQDEVKDQMLPKGEDIEIKEINGGGTVDPDKHDNKSQLLSGTASNSVETSPRALLGDPGSCTAWLGEREGFERYDKGKVLDEIICKLNLDNDYGEPRSWIGLGKNELQLTNDDIGNIRRRFGTADRGPASHIIMRMIEHGKKIGHLLHFLHIHNFHALKKQILVYHKNCPFCSQTENQLMTTV